MDKKQQRAVYGPGWIEIILGASLSLIVGVVLAALWLVFKPVVIAKEPAETTAQSSVYFLPGTTNAIAGRTWMRKKQLLAEGQPGNLVFTEEELNAWATATMKPPAATATDMIAPAQINFRIKEGVMQIGAPTTFNLFGLSLPVVIQTRGNFQKSGENFTFVPQELFLGSLPTHCIPGLTPKVVGFVSQIQPFPADVVEGWKKVTNVVIEGENLHLTF